MEGNKPETYIRATATCWLGDEPQPGVVRVEFLDADSRRHVFEDKVAMFAWEVVPTSGESIPSRLKIPCAVQRVEQTERGYIATVSTAPWAIESAEGQSQFLVDRESLIRLH